MSKRLRLFRVVLPFLALWLASCELSSHSGGTSDDTHSSIAVSGRVFTQDNKPLSAVVVCLRKANLSDTTDSEGKFTLVGDILPAWNSTTSSLDTLDYLRDGMLVHSAPVYAWIETMPDVYLVQRDISGTLSEIPSQPTNVVATIWNSRGEPISIDLDLNTATTRFSGFAWFRSTGGLDSFRIQIRASDSKGRPTGQSQELSFTSRAGDIQIPEFDPNNLRPRITFAVPPNSFRGAAIALHAEVKNLTGWGIQYEWSIGSGSWRKGSVDTAYTVPDDALGILPVRVRATRSDSLSTTDSVVIGIALSAPQTPNTRANARRLAVDGTIQRNAMKSGETHWYKFPVLANATYDIQLSCDVSDHCPSRRLMRAYLGSASTPFDSATEGFFRVNPLATDTLFLAFQGGDGYWDSVQYTLSVKESIAPSSDPESGNILTPNGSTYTGSLDKYSTAWFLIPVVAGTSYDIRQVCDSKVSKCATLQQMRIYRGASSVSADSSGSGFLHFYAKTNDTIRLSFQGYNPDQNPFPFGLRVDTSAFTGSSAIQLVFDSIPHSFEVVRDTFLPDGSTASDLVWFSFWADSGSTYNFLFESPNGEQFGAGCAFYRDSTNAAFASFGVDNMYNYGKPGQLIASKTGKIYLAFRTADLGMRATYPQFKTSNTATLSLRAWSNRSPVQAGNSKESATLLATDGLVGRTQFTGNNWMKFPIEAGHYYQIATNCTIPNGSYSSCQLSYSSSSDSGFAPIVIPSISDGPGGFWRYKILATRNDIIYVNLEARIRSGRPEFDYIVRERPEFRQESMGTASPLGEGETPASKTISDLNENWFRFHADSGKTYAISHTTDSANSLITSFWSVDSAKLTESVAKPSSTRSEFVCQKSGAYFYKVTSSSNLKYSTALVATDRLPTWFSGLDEFEPDGTMQTASTISVDAAPASHTLLPNDVDWIRFRTVPGKAYRINLASNQNCSLSVYSADSIQQPMGDAYLGARVFIPESGADFYLRVSTKSDSASYSVQVTTLSDDNYERDETRESAKEIPTTGAIQDRTLSGTPDLIKFRIQEGKNYWARIVNNTTNCVEARTLSDGLSSAMSGNGCIWGVKYLPAAAIADTFAYLEVLDKDPSESTPYAVSITPEVVDSFENDNTLSTAKPILTDGIFQHRSIAVGDQDWISFEVDSGATYRIGARAAWDSEPINMDLFSADSAQLGTQVSSPTPGMIVTGRRKTTYFIRITTPAPTSSPPNLPTSYNYVIDVQKQ